jgi:hypothetical protein
MQAGNLVDQVGMAAAASSANAQHQTAVRELAQQIERLSLMNQALWELLRDRVGITEAELEQKAQEVDLRDGVADGKMTATAVRCPTCQRVNNSRHAKCLYCGQLFQKPVFG